MEIIIDSLKKQYGSQIVLDDVSITIKNGMFGLLGRNGAGKTTLMRILTTLIKPTNGVVKMNGISISDVKKIRQMVGYLPQDFSFYPDMTVYESMKYMAALSEITYSLQDERIPKLLKQVNLWEERGKRIRALSGGMKRRLGIAQAILHNPPILFVDEPTVGLDPEERLRFYNLLEEYSENKIVMLSTHIVSDIENSCEKVGILDSGKLVFCDTVKKLAQVADGKVYELTLSKVEQNNIPKNYHVLSTKTCPSKNKIRVLSDSYPNIGNPLSCKPTVEDGYMELLRCIDRVGGMLR